MLMLMLTSGVALSELHANLFCGEFRILTCHWVCVQCMKWLEDQVFSIREAATKNLQQLASEFGPEWAKEHLVPQVPHVMPVIHSAQPGIAVSLLCKCLCVLRVNYG
jgi:hypothetical protein